MTQTITAVTSGKSTSYQGFVAHKSRYEMMSKKEEEQTRLELKEPVEGRMPGIGQ